MVDTSNEWIIERTGIKNRHIAEKNQLTSDLALEASKQALTNAGISAEQIDLIILHKIKCIMYLRHREYSCCSTLSHTSSKS